ncbi:MAG: hypothetical protein IJ959_02290 [Clostridia bacterium]|nr:hypothetical protein [Clostridia bacterium]
MKKSTFLGENKIAKSAKINGSCIENCKIEDDVVIMNSVLREAAVKTGAKIGPFAHLRPKSFIGENVRVGNFVEIKNSVIGDGTKIGHMTYIGDATVGKNCNIGAGVVFCNYDGKTKHQIKIGDNVFIGANCNLIAPLEIGDGAFIAAGTTVAKNVEAGKKIIGRVRQQEFDFKNISAEFQQKPNFFGTDGIRGVWGKDLNSKLCGEIAKALCLQGAKMIALGRDTRTSGAKILRILKKYFLAHGVSIVDLGIVPTPALAFATRKLQADFGVMITASHNPAEFNGIKIFAKDGHKIDEKTELALEKTFFQEDKLPRGKGKILDIGDAWQQYKNYIKDYCSNNLNGLHVALDCANGAASRVAQEIFHDLGAKVQIVNTNGVINQNCGALFPHEIQKIVQTSDADIGFAFDGDADRVIVVTKNGEILNGDEILWIIASDFYEKGLLKKPEVAGTILTNVGIEQKLLADGICLHRASVGDKNVEKLMAEKGLSLGAEQAGHIIFCKDNFRIGDGILAARVLCAIYMENKKLFANVKQNDWLQVQENIDISGVDKHIFESKKFESLIANFQKSFEKYGRVVVRKSGTEPKLRLLLEGKDPNICSVALEFLKAQILELV